MLFLRRKILFKFIAVEAVFLLAALSSFFLFKDYVWIVLISIPFFSCMALFLMVTRPLNVILRDIKALITGKPYNRLFTRKIDEIGVLAHFFNEVTQSLERVSSDIQAHRRLSSELNIAQKIQRDLLPQAAPKIPGLDIIAKTRPAAEIGGDSFDFISKGEQTFFYIGDVTGHGVPSGLVMMIVDTLIHTFTDMVENSYQLLTLVNKYLKPRIQTTMFMTMVMLRWKHVSQELFYSGAGHETIIHYKIDAGTVDNIRSGGIALGMVQNNEKLIKEQPIHWNRGDFLVLYSDGIVEATTLEGEMFGVERLVQLVEKWAPQSPSAEVLFQKLATEFTLFLGEHVQKDDMSLMVVRYGESGQSISTQWNMDAPSPAA